LLHKGDLSVQSEYGRGSTFLLKIPKGSAHLVDAEFILSSEIKVNQDVFEPIIDIQDELESIDKPSILIVEDNADLRGFLSEMFENNFKVISAFNGQDGLEKAQKELPDIIIADIMMPVMDGFSFNRELKKNPDLSGIPLIFLTAKDQKESEIQGFQEGADAYISKPFDPDILQNRVQNLLDSRLRLRKLLSDGSKIEKPPTPTELHPFLKKVNPIIQEHFQNPDFKIKQLSEFLFMDRSQVLRNMKSACGISPSEYLKKYRMEKARELLEKGEDNVSEIAYATGFNSLSYFSYSFKEFYKQSPSDLIQTIQNTYTE
ncbi:MAG: response regulator, partial [Balneolaceae bacterium]